jgi:hypothetical protein
MEAQHELDRDQAERDAVLRHDAAAQALRLESVQKETDAVVSRFNAASGPLAAAVAQLSDTRLVSDMATAFGPVHLLSGGTFLDTVNRVAPGIGERVTKAMKNIVGKGALQSLQEAVE